MMYTVNISVLYMCLLGAVEYEPLMQENYTSGNDRLRFYCSIKLNTIKLLFIQLKRLFVILIYQ